MIKKLFLFLTNSNDIFFKKSSNHFFAVEHSKKLNKDYIKILNWLFGNASYLKDSTLKGHYFGPVKEMTTLGVQML